jgi:hypothetical protein
MFFAPVTKKNNALLVVLMVEWLCQVFVDGVSKSTRRLRMNAELIQALKDIAWMMAENLPNHATDCNPYTALDCRCNLKEMKKLLRERYAPDRVEEETDV